MNQRLLAISLVMCELQMCQDALRSKVQSNLGGPILGQVDWLEELHGLLYDSTRPIAPDFLNRVLG